MPQEYTTNRNWPIPEAGTKPWYESFKTLMNANDADFQDMLNDLGLDTTTGDDYTGDALLMQVALHAPFNSRGSRERYIK